MASKDRFSQPVRVWLASGIGIALALLIGALLFPRRVYDEFIWQYFWGPVVADASAVGSSGCAVRHDGSVSFFTGAQECAAATGAVAQPGYTPVSTIVYTIVLLYALVGIVLLMSSLDLKRDPLFFFALVPFVFFGGALRVVEDANATIFRETGEMLIGLPWAGFIISPLIYFVVFGIVVGALVLSRSLAARGMIEPYEYSLAGIGTVCLLATLGVLGYFLVTSDLVGFSPIVPVIVLGGATALTAIVWEAIERYRPEINEGTGTMGLVVIWGHTVDGIANVLSIDWWELIGLSGGYSPKHVVNRGIIDVTSAVQPPSVSEAIGTAWPFLPIKILVAVVVVWVFNDEVFEESPAFSMILLIAILAVGLGPGTRDFLRATLGI